MLLVLSACGKRVKLELPENALEYTVQENSHINTIEIACNGKIYRPYAIANIHQAAEVVGYYKEESGLSYVLGYNGQSTDEWIITALDDASGYLNGNNIGFILKEVNVTNIPDEIKAEGLLK